MEPVTLSVIFPRERGDNEDEELDIRDVGKESNLTVEVSSITKRLTSMKFSLEIKSPPIVERLLSHAYISNRKLTIKNILIFLDFD
jgi:hypothetical protein